MDIIAVIIGLVVLFASISVVGYLRRIVAATERSADALERAYPPIPDSQTAE